MHAPQGYSSCVCLCVCPVRFLQTVTNWPRRPTGRLSTAIAWFIMSFFCKTASSRSYRIQVAAILAHLSAIFLALAGVQVYIHSCDIALDHVVFFTGFAIVFGATLYNAWAHLHHWTLTSTTCNCSPEGRYVLSTVLHVPKDSMSSVQCCSQHKEVALWLWLWAPIQTKIQMLDDQKDTMYADSMRKRAKRASESHIDL